MDRNVREALPMQLTDMLGRQALAWPVPQSPTEPQWGHRQQGRGRLLGLAAGVGCWGRLLGACVRFPW